MKANGLVYGSQVVLASKLINKSEIENSVGVFVNRQETGINKIS
jgi:hypothetical protein